MSSLGSAKSGSSVSESMSSSISSSSGSILLPSGLSIANAVSKPENYCDYYVHIPAFDFWIYEGHAGIHFTWGGGTFLLSKGSFSEVPSSWGCGWGWQNETIPAPVGTFDVLFIGVTHGSPNQQESYKVLYTKFRGEVWDMWTEEHLWDGYVGWQIGGGQSFAPVAGFDGTGNQLLTCNGAASYSGVGATSWPKTS